EELAKTILKNPAEVKIAVSKPAEKIRQSAYVCYEPQKLRIIENIFRQGGLRRVIIFSGKKTKVKDITAKLTRMKINCGAMHSDLTQAERDEIMFRFKSGQTDVLVATDIVSRGIDIDDILMVINYDVPHDAEDYVHRIGRTARAQRDGRAVTLVSEDDIYYFKAIEKFLEREVTKNPMPDGLDQGPDYKLPRKGGTRPKPGTRRNAGTPRNARAPRAAKGGKPRQSKDAGAGKKPDRQRRKPKEEGAKTAE
ncbi:MAG: C-terminal helicase domain-containing protein, partial [Prevotella sp.]|nr:C-terminal helicase domain-containing protein [Prevotella sp.]